MPIYRLKNNGSWRKLAAIYRLKNNGSWRKLAAIYRLKNNGSWRKVYSSTGPNLPEIVTAPVLQTQGGSTTVFKDGDTLTLDRGTWNYMTTDYSPTSYSLQIEKSADGSTGWTNASTGTGTSITYGPIAITEVEAPSPYIRGKVVATNKNGLTNATTTPVRLRMVVSASLSSTITIGDTSITVAWTVSRPLRDYLYSQTIEVYQTSNNSLLYTAGVLTTLTSHNIPLTSLPENTQVYVKLTVVGNDSARTSSVSTSANFFTPRPVTNPTSFSASDSTFTDRIRFTWSGGSADEYVVFQTTGSTTRPSDTSNSFTFSIGATSPNDWGSATSRGIQLYHFVKGRNSNGDGTYRYASTWFPAGTQGEPGRIKLFAPGQPTSLSRTVISSSQINISWVAPTTNTLGGPDAADGYDIYYNTSGTAPTASTNPLATTTSTSRAMTGLAASTTYYFWVRGYNADNTGVNAGPWSSFVSGTTLTNLANPTSFSASDATFTDRIRFTWSGGSGDEYVVFQTTSGTTRPSDTSNAFTFSIGATSPYDWGSATSRGIQLYHFVKARTTGGTYTSTWFPAGSQGEPGRIKLFAPGQPTSLSRTVISSSQINISWVAPTTNTLGGPDAASGYDIYYSTSSTAPTASTSPLATTTSTSRAMTGLAASTTYYFWVRGYNADNTGVNAGPWSSYVSGTTLAPAPFFPPFFPFFPPFFPPYFSGL